jgi:hypothetical protein
MTLEENRQKILVSFEALGDAAMERDMLGVLGHGAQLLDAVQAFFGSDVDRIGGKYGVLFQKMDDDPSFAAWIYDLAKTARSLLGSGASGDKQG